MMETQRKPTTPSGLEGAQRELFQARLRGLRDGLGLTQADAADLCGVDRSHWCRLEGGSSGPSLYTLIQIADGFDVSLDWLTGRDAHLTARPAPVPDDMKRMEARMQTVLRFMHQVSDPRLWSEGHQGDNGR